MASMRRSFAAWGCAAGLLPAQVPSTEPAKALQALAAAEQKLASGAFAAAVADYRAIAKKWPRTEGGALAQLRTGSNAYLGRIPLQVSGPSENRVDVFVLGDGYVLAGLNQFVDVAKSVPKNFGRDPVLDEYAAFHNFWAGCIVSREDGIDGFNREYDTALNGHMIQGSHEQAAVDHGAVRRLMANTVEFEGLAVVFVRAGHLGTGGGGIAVIGGREDDTVIHEWGHAFAGVGDEYVDKTHRGTPQSRINVSASGDPKQVPWKHWLDAKAPGIGVYEGAAGMQRGAWKPTTGGCVMESGRYFCAVCREAVVLSIYRRVDPIDGCKPPVELRLVARDESPKVALDLLKPKTHGLDVRFWVFQLGQEPPALSQQPGQRARRGPLPRIEAPPAHRVLNAGSRVEWSIPFRERAPGKYVVVCRVRDDTKVPRDTLPWVLKDDHGVLESERRWQLVVDR
jgi:hypothetical protein